MRRFGPMNGIAKTLASAFDRIGQGGKLREQMVLIKWSEVVGERIAKVSIAEKINGGVLWVVCKNSVWANELSLHREHIKSQLNASAGARTVSDIRFTSRGYTRLKNEQASPLEEEDWDITSVELDESQQQIAENVASTTKNKELAGAIKRAVTAGLKRSIASKKSLKVDQSPPEE